MSKPLETNKLLVSGSILPFIRRKDFKFIKELGQGACGQTVLLLDDEIKEHFVCKKYTPYAESKRSELFENFVREIKLLHRVFHLNIVRVFNYYLYRESLSGFILMEYIEGKDILETIEKAPETINELFLQAISGFQHLEKENILHRDIRQSNILVRADGILKIIDLGFGKGVQASSDFDKSISLNLWCDPPKEFANRIYDFRTEVYFVGKLFEQALTDYEIDCFQYEKLLGRMCAYDPEKRLPSFFEVNKEIKNGKFKDIEFTKEEANAYLAFSDKLRSHITKVEAGAKYRDDIERIQIEIETAYRDVMLEEFMPDAVTLLRCFIKGTYYYKRLDFPVDILKQFLALLKGATKEQKRIIFANIQTRLSPIDRYNVMNPSDDDIPF